MKRYIKLYRKIVSTALMRVTAYPEDFLLWVVIDALWSVVNIGFFRVLLLVIPEIVGWSFNELTVPLGILYLLNAFIWGFLNPNMTEFPKDINKGNLDMYLVKPVNSQFLVSTRYISINLIPSIVSGIFLLWYGFRVNHITFAGIFVIPLALICAAVISYAVWFVSVTTTFWFNRLLNIGVLYGRAVDVARYPVAIFNPLMRFVFTFIIPFAMMGFVPAEVMLGRISPLNLLWPIFLAALFLWISHWFWNFSLKRYSSASS